MSTTTMNVIVHKSLDLRSGETLSQFTSDLATKGRDHVMKKLNMADSDGGAYMLEVFSKSVVFRVWKAKESPSKDKTIAFTFERDKNGNFSFGDTTEVIRVTRFEVKPNSVSKGMGTSKRIYTESQVVAKSADGNYYVRP